MHPPADAPLVSVIMPVYNHSRYVADALHSIISQDWRPLEVIVIDDGSKDDSLDIVKRIADALPESPGLTLRVSGRENKGAHTTINEGLAMARGEYLAILNSDDMFMPGRLRRCLEAAKAHKSRMVISYVDPIDDDGNPLSGDHPWRHWYADVMMHELDLAPSLSSLLLRYNIGVSTGNFFFHRSLLEEIGPLADYRYAHDLDFLLRASYLEEPVLVRDKLYRYRVHASNTIKESDEKATAEVAKIVREYLLKTFDAAPKNPLAPQFNNGCYHLGSTPWPPHLGMAIDSLMYGPTVRDIAKVAPSVARPLNKAPAPEVARKSITLLSHELSRTGAPVLLRDVASALHGASIKTNVVSLGTGPLADDYAKMGSPVVTDSALTRALSVGSAFLTQLANDRRVPGFVARPMHLAARVSGVAGSRLRLLNYRRKLRPTGTLLINSFASWPLALPLLDRWKGPAYWYIHETFEPAILMRGEKHQQRLRNLYESGKFSFLFGSDATRAKWASDGYDGEVFYWSGLSSKTEYMRFAPRNKQIILSVQSTGPRKGTLSLIEGFAIARRQGLISKDAELHIVGAHQPSKNQMSRDFLCRIMQPDVRGSVHLIPNLAPDELDAHYSSATVYVQSSTMECLPLALLSAMAHGLPIISTDADGCREAILNEETGLLIASRQPELMAQALGRMLSNPEAADRMAKAARERFEQKFSLEVTVQALLERLTR